MKSLIRLALAHAVLLSAGCSPNSAEQSEASKPSEAAKIVIESDGSQECSSPDTYSTIKEIIFDKAVEIAGGNPVSINDLRMASSIRMDVPLVKGYNKEIKRAECSGRFVMSIPVTARAAFSGEQELKADLTYSVQPAADGQGNVVGVYGIEYVVRDIVSANSLRAARQIENQGGPHLVNTFNPSFNCGPMLSNTERMICQDQDLSRKDRLLSKSFKAKLAATPGSDRGYLLTSQRASLAARATCADTSCINEWYDSMLAEYGI